MFFSFSFISEAALACMAGIFVVLVVGMCLPVVMHKIHLFFNQATTLTFSQTFSFSLHDSWKQNQSPRWYNVASFKMVWNHKILKLELKLFKPKLELGLFKTKKNETETIFLHVEHKIEMSTASGILSSPQYLIC